MPLKDSFSNNFCQCVEGPYPEWFKQYMKKFKRELLKDIRSNISEIVHEEFEKEKELADAKSCKPLPDKIESSSTTKLTKKKKMCDKDVDMFEKREMKLLKKIEKLYSYKFDRLLYPVVCVEKMESKASPLLEERRQLLEKRRQNKTLEVKKKYMEPDKKYMELKKKYLEFEKKCKEPEKKCMDPEKKSIEPEKKCTVPEKKYMEPEKKCMVPEKKCMEPEKKYMEPEKKCMVPEKKYMEPEKKYMEPEKKYMEPEKKYKKNGKFTITSESSVFLILQPGAEFSFTVNILNNGRVPWISPHMECLSTPDICIREKFIRLPKLEPGHNVSVTIKGKATQSLGHHCFTYKLFDGSEGFGPLFSCFAVVSDSKKKIFPKCELLNHNNKATSGNFVGTLIDSENVTISSSQKQIKENIIEIERTLQDIHLLRQLTSSDKSREESLNDNPKEFQVKGCDSVEDERKFWKESLEEELICTADSFEQMGKTEKSEIVENENFETKKNGPESDSDSELSIILSEEDENFIFVSLLSESSNSETLNNTTKSSKLDLSKESKEANQKPKKAIDKERSEKVEPKEVGYKGISACENCLCHRSITEDKGCTENAKPSFEPIPTSTHVKPSNIISNGCFSRNTPSRMFEETYFPPRYTAHNVKSNGSPIGYSAEEISFSENMKTGEEKNHDQNDPNYAFYNTHECCALKDMKTHYPGKKDDWPNFVHAYDCLGKPIYAVRYDGYCLPVEDLIHNTVRVPDVVGTVDSKEETQKELKAQTSVNHVANEDATKTTTQNGMISVASKAFETAKCVINNLQSAFKQEMENKPGDTEKLKPHDDPINNFPFGLYSMGEEERRYVEKSANKEIYKDAMLELHEMGFVNSDLNFRLLKEHNCELLKVITVILDMQAEETVGVTKI